MNPSILNNMNLYVVSCCLCSNIKDELTFFNKLCCNLGKCAKVCTDKLEEKILEIHNQSCSFLKFRLSAIQAQQFLVDGKQIWTTDMVLLQIQRHKLNRYQSRSIKWFRGLPMQTLFTKIMFQDGFTIVHDHILHMCRLLWKYNCNCTKYVIVQKSPKMTSVQAGGLLRHVSQICHSNNIIGQRQSATINVHDELIGSRYNFN